MTLRTLIAAIFGLQPYDPRLDVLEAQSRERSWAETEIHLDIPEAETVEQTQVHARASDPAGSQAFAEVEFNTANQREEILAIMAGGEWLDCRELGERLYGEGPYPPAIASLKNKIQTSCLVLHRRGLLERDESGERLRYRRHWN